MAVVAAHLNYPQYSKTQAFCQYACVIKWAKWCGNCGKLRTITSVIMMWR
nr:MAG TPA: Thioredoxin domain [Caudoviricetes sp.]